ncbi:peptide/nickel transport system substrate-binding protein [Conyzicola lurida]|uniref:Peptide/nickel transport system substrate-binding protein n=1 Tax=Conyzicola lurida TaxID=1172621 RepID=A0A841AL44_9MICO|nr:ABC transporter substrate-binding protein [Conyzicola lurida]MBB5842159.1 peptide/nickel transport system substrate-binding protein [Conyzicola lurida]
MKFRTRLASVALVATASLLLAACAPSDSSTSGDSETPVAGGTLSYAIAAQPGTGGLDPIVASNAASNGYLSQIYETLLVKNDEGEIEPGLAESYEQLDDLNYTFTLRDGVEFSDGTPLTVQDVVYSFNTWLASTSTRKQFLAGVDTITAIDDKTVQFTFSTVNATFLNAVSSRTTFYILNEAWYSALTPDERQRQALGTGAFALDSWTDNVSLSLVKNENYWQEGLPYLDGIDFQIVPDETARLALTQQGSTDVASFTDAAVANQAADAGYTVGDASYTRKISIYINPTTGPLADLNVRRALSLSLDRDQIVDLAAGGSGAVSLTVVVGDPASTTPDADTPYYTRDIDAAKELLEEAGQPNPTIQLSYPSDYTPEDIPVFEVMKEQAAEAGINIELVATPWADISRIFTYGESWTDMVAIWNVVNVDPAGYFNQFLLDEGQMAYFDGNPDADEARALHQELQTTTDPETRAELTVALDNEVADKVIKLIPLAKAQLIEVWDDTKIGGYSTDPYSSRWKLKELYLK